MINESKRPVTIEDLLRLKRAEHPPAEFWNDFDRALRAKQLAALVEKRPWWHAVPTWFARARRYQIPIGASAVLAVSFLSFRHYAGSAHAPTHSVALVSRAAAAVAVTPTEVAADSSKGATVTSPGAMAVAVAAPAVTRGFEVAAAPLVSEATAPGELAHIIPSIGTSAASEDSVSSARAIATGLVAVRGAEPSLSHTLLNNEVAEVRPLSRMVVEPLQQITPPSERRRSNLQTAMVSMTSFEAPTRVSEHTTSRLSQEELYDRIHRFDARGAGVMMKF